MIDPSAANCKADHAVGEPTIEFSTGNAMYVAPAAEIATMPNQQIRMQSCQRLQA
jgi:hypothetical protein